MSKEPVNVNEFQELARQALPKMYYDFYSGGAEDQHTLKENIEAFQRILFRPRVLIDVRRINLSTTILGYSVSAPIMIAPTGLHKLAHYEGEIATARAAAACNTIMVLSYASTCTVEEVASSCNAIRFFQLCACKRRDVSAQLVERAERSGYKAIVLTVDAPKLGRRERDIKNKMISPQWKNFEGLLSTEVTSVSQMSALTSAFEHDDSLFLVPLPDHQSFPYSSGNRTRVQICRHLLIMQSMLPFHGRLEPFVHYMRSAFDMVQDIDWLKSITKLPILIKGVLTGEDAIKAVEVGAAGIVVSNHGARQLDYTPATISVLEEVVQAVRGRVPVFVDGGIRRGTDVFKALALGAQAVLVGRPVIYGLAAKGEHGVRRVLEMLKDELELTMALSGCPSLKDITRNHIKTEHDRLRCML